MEDMIKIDLHMHSTVSDGTDTPLELLQEVRAAGIKLFALTDHDAFTGYEIIRETLTAEDPQLLSGVELSCRDEKGKYHILGYGFDPENQAILNVIGLGQRFRMRKLTARLDFLHTTFGFDFPEEEIHRLMELDNPGKPHIANLMVKYGYADSIREAIENYINRVHFSDEYVSPEEGIQGILQSGGIPVLAHPAFGSGEELIIGDEMDERLRYLTGFGLQGLEAFYSGFSPKLQAETLFFADKYGLYTTAGSDYHGKNKLVILGDNNLDLVREIPDSMRRFLEDCRRI